MGCDGDLLLPHPWASPNTSHRTLNWKVINQQDPGQSHQSKGALQQQQGRIRPPGTILPCKVAQKEAGAWSLLLPDTGNNYMIMRFGSKVQINL